MPTLSARERLFSIREAGGEEALTDLAPLVLSIGMAPGWDHTDPAAWYSPSMTVGPTVNPTLEALMDFHRARRAGRASWQVGHGEDSPKTALSTMLTAARAGTVWPRQMLIKNKGPRPLRTDPLSNAYNGWQRARTTPAISGFLNGDRMTRHGNLSDAYLGNAPRLRGARFGVVAVQVGELSTWLSVHTTDHLELPEDLAEEIGEVNLNLWAVGKGFKPAALVYPAQAIAIAEWAAQQGLGVIPSDESQSLGKFRAAASTSVIAWPRRGRPAQATVAVGRRAPKQVRSALLGRTTSVAGRTALVSDTDSVALAGVLATLPQESAFVHPAVLDAARLASAEPVRDERLRSFQQLAVGRHVATDTGYVNASSPGAGKTIMVLDALRRRAAAIPGYRALAVVEANVRDQWCKEAAKWFPAATVVQVTSRSDASTLRQTLSDAGPFPVLVITSYALASDAAPETDPAEAEEDLGEADLDVLLDGDGGIDDFAQPAAESVPAPSTVPAKPVSLTLAPPAEGDEPADLLELLAMILSEGQESTEEESEARLGEILPSQHWHDIIADEAVGLRASSTRQSKALWRLREQSDVAVALTGTPIDKGLNDLGHLVAWVRNDRKLFHGISLEEQFDLSDPEQMADYKDAIGALVFRVDKSEFSDELPEPDPIIMRLEPTAAESALANAARNELKRAYEELVNGMEAATGLHPDDPQYATAMEALKAARHAWLGGTTLARMAASDPAALLTAKGAAVALLASQGLIAAATAHPGTKRIAVVADVVDRVARGERIIVFTEFASVAKGLIEDLDASGVRVGAVIGGGGRKRDRHVAAFRSGDLDVLVATSAGERGLNLQTATTLYHYDLPWTPKGVIQRSGRVERIGATNARLQIVFPIMAGTIEDRVVSVVMARAATAMRALDTVRGVDVRRSDVGRALGGLAAQAIDDEVSSKQAVLLQITRELLAA